MSRRLEVGRPPRYEGRDPYLRALSRWLSDLAEEMKLYSEANDRAAGDPYTVTNGSEARSLDASAATLDDVRKTLGTVITDLRNKGTLK